MGNGNTASSTNPQLTQSLGVNRKAVAISVGTYQVCALLDDITFKCWGDNTHGQLGDGSYNSISSPPNTSISFGHREVATPERDLNSDGSIDIFQSLDNDSDGDIILDINDGYPNDPIRAVNCTQGTYGRYICVNSSLGHYVPNNSSMS